MCCVLLCTISCRGTRQLLSGTALWCNGGLQKSGEPAVVVHDCSPPGCLSSLFVKTSEWQVFCRLLTLYSSLCVPSVSLSCPPVGHERAIFLSLLHILAFLSGSEVHIQPQSSDPERVCCISDNIREQIRQSYGGAGRAGVRESVGSHIHGGRAGRGSEGEAHEEKKQCSMFASTWLSCCCWSLLIKLQRSSGVCWLSHIFLLSLSLSLSIYFFLLLEPGTRWIIWVINCWAVLLVSGMNCRPRGNVKLIFDPCVSTPAIFPTLSV